jgi:hypothetical protein
VLPRDFRIASSMAKANEYVTDLLKKIREDISEIKRKLFTEKPKLEAAQAPPQYSIDAVHKNSDTNKEETPSERPIIRARINLPEAITVKAETEERIKPWKQDRHFLLQMGAIAVGAIVAVIYYCQLQTMQDQLTEAREEQRPYISVIRFDVLDSDSGKPKDPPDFVAGKPLMVNVVFKNIGKSPAVNVLIHRHLLFGKEVNRFKVEVPDRDRQGSTLDPGPERVVTAVSVTDTYSVETGTLNPDDIVNWDGSQPIIVFGRISYLNVAGVIYCTPYAIEFTPKINRWPMNTMNISDIDHIKIGDLCPEGKR